MGQTAYQINPHSLLPHFCLFLLFFYCVCFFFTTHEFMYNNTTMNLLYVQLAEVYAPAYNTYIQQASAPLSNNAYITSRPIGLGP